MTNDVTYNKTLEQLENDYWESPASFPTGLVERVFLLRKKILSSFEVDDIRFLLSQGFGLKYLIPIAINLLRINIYEEALYYPGDLLLAVLEIRKNYWHENPLQRDELIDLLNKSLPEIRTTNSLDKDEKNKIIQGIKGFLKGNE